MTTDHYAMTLPADQTAEIVLTDCIPATAGTTLACDTYRDGQNVQLGAANFLTIGLTAEAVRSDAANGDAATFYIGRGHRLTLAPMGDGFLVTLWDSAEHGEGSPVFHNYPRGQVVKVGRIG